jgi:hypothetical protein
MTGMKRRMKREKEERCLNICASRLGTRCKEGKTTTAQA